MISELRNPEATTEDVADAAKAELQEGLKENLDNNQDSEGVTDKRSEHVT